MLATSLVYNVKAVTDLDTFNGIDTHQRMGNIGIQTIKYWFTQAWHNTCSHNGNFSTNRISFFV